MDEGRIAVVVCLGYGMICFWLGWMACARADKDEEKESSKGERFCHDVCFERAEEELRMLKARLSPYELAQHEEEFKQLGLPEEEDDDDDSDDGVDTPIYHPPPDEKEDHFRP